MNRLIIFALAFGDNDKLSALVASKIDADLLIMLTDVHGLYTDNPNTNTDAQHYDVVTEITPKIEAVAGDAGSGLSKGGMKTKVMAAKLATDCAYYFG